MSKVIIYWSGTGNTEQMAQAIYEGAGAEARLLPVAEATVADVETADTIFFGCPSMGDEVLEEEVMEPFVESVKDAVKGKSVGLFGSYGWGDGQWMRDWQARMESYGARVDEPIICMSTPNEGILEELRQWPESI